MRRRIPRFLSSIQRSLSEREDAAGAVLHDHQLFVLAREVESTVLRVLEEVKPGRHLKTNVEFYTALVLQSLGLAPVMFVAMFGCGRCAGWCAHVIEQHQEDHLIRPQSEYVGPRGPDRRPAVHC